MDEKPNNDSNFNSNTIKVQNLSNQQILKEEKRQNKKKKTAIINVEEDQISHSPDKRFVKYKTEVGRGAFKTVYIGLDTLTGKQIAWCELPIAKINKDAASSLENEAKMLKSLSHPNILKMYDLFYETNGNLVLITELMTSGTLKKYVMSFKTNTISTLTLKNFTKQILKGLYFLHNQFPPIIHRDLKCDNVFISGSTGSVKIGDYGLSKYKTESYAESSIGTPEFMAPEMYNGNYTEKVDIYAFGMCFLELITQEYPYKECVTAGHIYKKVTSGELPDCFIKLSDCKEKKIIQRCINFDPEKRPNAKQLLDLNYFRFTKFALDIVSKFSNNEIINFELQNLDLHRERHKEDTQVHLNEDEAIQFEYNIATDSPDSMALLMAHAGILNHDDIPEVVALIKYRIEKLSKEPNEVADNLSQPISVVNVPLSNFESDMVESNNLNSIKLDLKLHNRSNNIETKSFSKINYSQIDNTSEQQVTFSDSKENLINIQDKTSSQNDNSQKIVTGFYNLMDTKSMYEVQNTPMINGKINCCRVIKQNMNDVDEISASSSSSLPLFSKEYFLNLRRVFDMKNDEENNGIKNDVLSQSVDFMESNIEDIINKATITNRSEQDNLIHRPLSNKNLEGLTFNLSSESPIVDPPPFITKLDLPSGLTPHHKILSFGFPHEDMSTIDCLPFDINMSRKYYQVMNKTAVSNQINNDIFSLKNIEELSLLDAELSNTFYSQIISESLKSNSSMEKSQNKNSSVDQTNIKLRSLRSQNGIEIVDVNQKHDDEDMNFSQFKDKFVINAFKDNEDSFIFEIDVNEDSTKLNFKILRSDGILQKLYGIFNALLSQNYIDETSMIPFINYLHSILAKRNLITSTGMLFKNSLNSKVREPEEGRERVDSDSQKQSKFNITRSVN